MFRLGTPWYTHLLGLGLILSLPAWSQPPTKRPAPEGWQIRLGAGGLYSPDYTGSDDFESRAIPWFDVQYDDWFFARFPDGIGINAYQSGNITAGAAFGYGSGRDNEGDLAPIKEVEAGALGNAFATYQWGYITLQARFSKAISGDIEGESITLGASTGRPFGEWFARASTSASWHSDDWIDALFSLSASEAKVLGVSAFSADGGLSEARLSTMVVRSIGKQSSLTAFVSLSRLLGDAEKSPITNKLGDPTQYVIGVVLGYEF